MPWLEPITLHGTHVILEPLAPAHHDDLVESVKDGEFWKLWYTIVADPGNMRAEIDRRLDLQSKGMLLPFAVRDTRTAKVVGMTNYMNVEAAHRRVEIGGTWYRKSVQRTPLNTECKLLLLAHAFEKLDCICVELRTHFFNHQSRKAIERLGAKLDGILRNNQIATNGILRDTCVYSIIASEWPTVKSHLTWKLAAPAGKTQE
ncbi:MAG TPA: GNAT family protein [Candidatus Angelobacter sp.]|jgi:RimJ/RimL family protein N-acetyltransferase